MTKVVQVLMAATEVKIFPVDFSPSFLDGETLTSADAVHTPPGSDVPLVPDVQVSGNIAQVTVGPLASLGTHLVDVHGIGSEGSEPEVRIQVRVNW